MSAPYLTDQEFNIIVNMICDDGPSHWANDYFTVSYISNLGIRWDGIDLGTFEYESIIGIDFDRLDQLLPEHDPYGILSIRIMVDTESSTFHLFTEDQKIKYHNLMTTISEADKL